MQVDGRKWDRRLARARELAETHAFARQVLRFYIQLTSFQKTSYLQYASAGCSLGPSQSSLPSTPDDIDLTHLLTRWRPFISMLETEAPGPLAECASQLKASGTGAGGALLRGAWPAKPQMPVLDRGEPAMAPTAKTAPVLERFCASSFLQPFAESLADRAHAPTPIERLANCPFCGSPPMVGVLRPEGDGGKRCLICSFCRTEWDYLRIACPACDERREQQLIVYATSKFGNVRIEACETCKSYIKTVDLTKSGLAVPEVDDLAALPLSLWAEEQGYQKLASGSLYL